MVVPKSEHSHWDYFHLLGSFDDKAKFGYAVKLYLLFVKSDGDDDTRGYILSRIIGALGAMSNSMRAGAFSLFNTILVNSPELCDYDSIQSTINKQLKPTGTLKADAEAYVGLLLAYKSLVQSRFLDKTPSRYNDVAEGLMELSVKKSYLHAEALHLLGVITERTKQEYGTEAFIQHLKDFETYPLDKLGYLLQIERNVDDSEILAHLFDGNRLTAPSTAPEVGIIISKCSNSGHLFLKEFANVISESSKYVSRLWKSYEEQVKEKLESGKATLDMYFSLLSLLLRTAREKKKFKSAKTLVSDVAVQMLLKHSKNKPDLVKNVCKSISELLFAAADSSLTSVVLEKLAFSPGNFSFDETTCSKLIGSVWRTLDGDETKLFGDKCLKIVVEGGGVTNRDRVNALNIFGSVLNSPATSSDTKWRIEGLKMLLTAGLVVRDNVSVELSTIIRKSFFNNITGKYESLQAYGEVLEELVKCMNKCLKKPLRVKIKEEVKSTWKLSQELISSLEKGNAKKAQNKAVLSTLKLLTCFIALKSIDEPKDAQLSLADIKSVVQRILSNEDTDGPEWIEVLMDLFLSMLSKPNASNRTVIRIVFKSLLPHFTDGAFSQLVEVLDKSYDLNKPDEGDEGMDVDEDGSDAEESSDSDDDDEEEEESESASENEDGSGGDDDDEEDEDEEGVDNSNSRAFNQEKLQFDLRNALMPVDSDAESINIDDMEEEQGKQLDATLSAIFRNAMVRKKPSKRESITNHFKIRVLDLMEIYCSVGMPIHHWMTLLPKLLDLAESCVAVKNATSLKGRLLSFARKISNAKIAGTSNDRFEADKLVELTKMLIDRAANASGAARELKSHFQFLVRFCIKNSHQIHPDNMVIVKESLSEVMADAVSKFFSEKKALDLDLVTYLCENEWCGVHAVANQVMESALGLSTKPYDRTTGLNLLAKYFKNDRNFANASDEDTKSVKKLVSRLLDSLFQIKSELGFDQQTQHLVTQLVSTLIDGKCSNFVKWKKWKELLPQMLSSPKKPCFIQPFNLMCRKLDIPHDQFPSLVNETSSATKKSEKSSPKPKANKRKRQEVDVRKLKKESKIRRLAAMDGLEQVSWNKLAGSE